MTYTIIQGSKIIETLKSKLSSIRTGRVNASILDNLNIEAYGTHLSIKELATISVPEPSQLLITPFDKTIIQAIEKALVDSNIGANPNNDGAGIRLIFPPLNEETRILKTKEVHKILEEVKIISRTMRQDLLKSQKRLLENSEISEDEMKRYESDLQKEIDALNKEMENLGKQKEEDILKI